MLIMFGFTPPWCNQSNFSNNLSFLFKNLHSNSIIFLSIFQEPRSRYNKHGGEVIYPRPMNARLQDRIRARAPF